MKGDFIMDNSFKKMFIAALLASIIGPSIREYIASEIEYAKERKYRKKMLKKST